MSAFAEVIQNLCASSRGFQNLKKGLTAELIEEACVATALPKRRRRRLPSDVTVWLIVGIAMFRDEAIPRVAKLFGLCLGTTPASSSLSEARERLGPHVLRWLYQKLGLLWSNELKAEKYRGLSLLGIDGSTLTLEDTKANVAAFGKPGSRKDKMPAARPQIRSVGLMDLSTKLLVDGELVPLKVGENTALQPLLERIPDSSITILDRGFQSKSNFYKLHNAKSKRHFLVRVKKTFQPRWVRDASGCSWIGEISFTAKEREADGALPKSMPVRIIEYRVAGHKDDIRLATSLLDERTHAATELAELYHRRWEYELGLRDLKSTLLQGKATLRSKTPDGVYQELWGIFLGYNLVRHEMAVVAAEHGVSPSRLSFKNSLSMVSNFFRVFSSDYVDRTGFGDALVDMRHFLWSVRLRERDPERVCPRWLKDKQPAKFPKKPSSIAGV